MRCWLRRRGWWWGRCPKSASVSSSPRSHFKPEPSPAMRSPSLHPPDLEFFKAQGYLQLKGFHPKAKMGGISKSIIEELKRLKIWASGKSLPHALHGLPPFQQIARLSTLVKIPGLHEALITPQLASIIAALAGRAPSAPQDTQLLLSLPRQGEWSLEGLNWHVDIGSAPLTQLPGIQAFVLLDDVLPRGGATLALAGSHHANTRQMAAQPPLREVLRTTDDLEVSLRDLGIAVVENVRQGRRRLPDGHASFAHTVHQLYQTHAHDGDGALFPE
jgi:hypothetical protein